MKNLRNVPIKNETKIATKALFLISVISFLFYIMNILNTRICF